MFRMSEKKNKPYEIKEGLWFIPAKSKNVPSFEGIYVQRPYRIYPNSAQNPFTSINDMITIYPESETLKYCTLFADSDESVNYYKQLGFERVYNIQNFENDEWEIVGLKSKYVSTKVNGVMQPYGSGNWLNVVAEDNENILITGANIIRTTHLTNYSGKYYAFFWSAPYPSPDQPRALGNTAIYAVYEKADQTKTPTGFCLGSGIGTAEANEYTYETLWASPTKKIKIYKNIVLMNGAKIRRGI